MFKSIKLIALTSVMFVLCFAVNASATPINTSATVVTSVTVAEVTPLNFGSFVPSGAAGTVTFSADDTTATVGGGVTAHLGGEINGVVSTSGFAVGNTVQVFLTPFPLTGPGTDMTVVPDCRLSGVGAATANTCTFTATGATDNVQIGGVLSVGANQTPGVYSGTIEVTAGFF